MPNRARLAARSSPLSELAPDNSRAPRSKRRAHRTISNLNQAGVWGRIDVTLRSSARRQALFESAVALSLLDRGNIDKSEN